MENETLVKIPSLCVGCSQGFISKMSNIFDELEKGNNRYIIFDLDFIPEFFQNRRSDLFNPKTFLETIEEIFDQIIEEVQDDLSEFIINGIKNLISTIVRDMDLDQDHDNYRTYFVINNINLWFDFLREFFNRIELVEILVIRILKEEKGVVYHFDSSLMDDFEQYFNILSSSIDNYWTNQNLVD